MVAKTFSRNSDGNVSEKMGRTSKKFDEMGGGGEVFEAMEKAGSRGRDDCGVALESGIGTTFRASGCRNDRLSDVGAAQLAESRS